MPFAWKTTSCRFHCPPPHEQQLLSCNVHHQTCLPDEQHGPVRVLGSFLAKTVSHTKSLGAGMPWQKGMLCDWQPVLSGFQCHVSQILLDLQPHQEEFCPFLCYIKLDSPRAQGLWSSLVLRLGVSESISKADSVQKTERKDDNCEPSLLCIFPLEAAQ